MIAKQMPDFIMQITPDENDAAVICAAMCTVLESYIGQDAVQEIIDNPLDVGVLIKHTNHEKED